MAHHAHIRCTPYESECDLSGIVQGAEKYIITTEFGRQLFKPHFHIMMYVDACEKTIRNRIYKCLEIPKEHREIKGKENAYYCLKYDKYSDPSPAYLCKDVSGTLGVVSSRGYTPAEISEFQRLGLEKFGPGSDYFKKKYPGKRQPEETIVTPVEGPKVSSARPSAWKDLNDAFADVWYDTPDEDKYIWDINRIGRWIKHRFLKNHQPIPAESNTRRWAYSLFAIYAKDVETEGMKAIEAIDSIILSS